MAELLIEGQVQAILNYAPIRLSVPDEVLVEYIDPVIALQSMTYYLGARQISNPNRVRAEPASHSR
ncbi:MAG: hypothetical protein Q9O62_03920 [Ardenticatenia bacterium]|nr:hypothetical protein [Ardenticatenia bacterium]